MCRIFNFYIKSQDQNTGSTNSNTYYFIDWSATIPRGKYKCSFVYNSVTSNNVIGPDNGDISPALIHINLGCNSNFSFTNKQITNTDIIGMLKWCPIEDVSGKGFLYSDINTNVPFFFNNGTLNNFINVKITDFDAETFWIDTNGYGPSDYVLCLTFELIDEL